MAKKTGHKPTASLRNRIIGLQSLRGADLQDHAGNWRTHPQHQAEAMAGVLREVGIAGALLVYDSVRYGGLTVIDGHLRKALHPDQEWPCLMTDLTDEEADYVLLTHDWLGFRAEANREQLDVLLRDVSSGEAAVQAELAVIAEHFGVIAPVFDPASEVDQPRLDEKTCVKCPECGHEFLP